MALRRRPGLTTGENADCCGSGTQIAAPSKELMPPMSMVKLV
jgi:hypothetical protein